MSTCIMPTSTFSVESGNVWEGREGWLLQSADDKILAKRYVGIDATDDDGVLHNVLRDCEHDCDGPGKTYSDFPLDGHVKDSGKAKRDVTSCTECVFASTYTATLTTWNSSCDAVTDPPPFTMIRVAGGGCVWTALYFYGGTQHAIKLSGILAQNKFEIRINRTIDGLLLGVASKLWNAQECPVISPSSIPKVLYGPAVFGGDCTFTLRITT